MTVCWRCLLNITLDVAAWLTVFGLSLALDLPLDARVGYLVPTLWLGVSLGKGLWVFLDQGGCGCDEGI